MMTILHCLSLLPFGRGQAKKNGGGKTHPAEEMLIGMGVTNKV